MTIFKIIGSVEEQKSTIHARIKVHSFKKNGITINSIAEIKDTFPAKGYVFAPNFFEELEVPLYSLVEFSASLNSYIKDDNHDVYIMQNFKDCRQVGFSLIKLPNIPFISNLSIDQSKLKTLIKTDATHFYISCNNYIYGPFKSSNSDILPKTGTEIFRFEEENGNQVTTGENAFLLNPPKKIIDKVDCMTAGQLSDWMKVQLKSFVTNVDFNQLKKLLESQQLQDLNKVRFERAIISLDNLSLTNDYLKALAGSSEKYLKIYENAITKIEAELKETLVEPYQKKKQNLEQELSAIQIKIKKIRLQEDEAVQKLKEVKASFDHMVVSRERLIEDIKVQSLINKTTGIEKLITYHDYYEKRESPAYLTIDEFANDFQNSVQSQQTGNLKYARKIIYQFRDFRCILSDTIEPVLQFSKLCGNARVFIQQVEPDWLKFEKLYENGLRQIWSASHDDPETIHLLILEDINLASIECYGKPILDMLSNVRNVLPGLKTVWPSNLWIIAVPMNQVKDAAFGLPLISQTFNKWGAFPKNEPVIFSIPEKMKILHLKTLVDHEIIISNPIAEYFATT